MPLQPLQNWNHVGFFLNHFFLVISSYIVNRIKQFGAIVVTKIFVFKYNAWIALEFVNIRSISAAL